MSEGDELLDDRLVETNCPAGALQGLDHGSTKEFRGVRFATASRFEAPVDVEHWDGRLDALAFGDRSPQVGGPLEQMLSGDDSPMSEDCLSLNVWTPGCDDGARPVLVWIHGGAFVTGSGSMPWYDGNALAARGDVVVVTINYRLGAFGFLGDRNLGLLDTISALRWVRRNIAAFGGSADDVTLFGESAGGCACVALTAAPEADDLFHRAWAMSPSIPQVRSVDLAHRLETSYLALLGHADVDAARRRTVDDLLDAQARLPLTGAGLQNFSPAEPTALFPAPILRTASDDQRPLVIGSTRDEMLLFTAFDPKRASWGDDDLRTQFEHRFGDDAASAIDAYRTHRPDRDASGLVSAMQTDEVFRAPVQRLASKRSDAGRPTWVYEFHQTSSAFGGRLGACHGLDIPFAFHNLTRKGAETFTGGASELGDVADRFSDAILAFAHGGEPGWSAYDTDRRATQIVGRDPELVDDPEPALRTLWF